MFSRRGKTDDSTSVLDPVNPAGKGRATPKRADAERERRERARGSSDPKERARQQRTKRAEDRKQRSEGMMRGEEQYLMPRDRGPRRRFIRDFVDGRFTAAELFLPMAVVILLLGLFGSSEAEAASMSIWMLMVVFIIVDSLFWTTRLRGALKRRFPDEPKKRGDIAYAMMRGMLSRFLRTPKAQVKRGTRPV
ncbi:MAG: DUF3043 domain-containing protein [Sporichthyaceae bacterium]